MAGLLALGGDHLDDHPGRGLPGGAQLHQVGPAHRLGRRQHPRGQRGRHQHLQDQVRKLHDHRVHGGADRAHGDLPDQLHRPEQRQLHAHVLCHRGSGHRRHRAGRRVRHYRRRLPRHAGAGDPVRRLQPGRDQRQPAADHPRWRDPGRHDRERATSEAETGREDAMSTPEPDGTGPVAEPDSGTGLAVDGTDVLRVEHISTRFGAVTALVDVSLHLRQGEVLALLGDNGAGKSTLLKILCGFQPPDTGRIILNGQEVTLKSVDAARALGIDVVYQDLALIDQLTVYHNMFLKREKVRWPLLNNRAMRRIARERLDDMGIGLKSVDAEVARLSGGQRQAIAIARAIYSDAKVLLLDEPLAAMGAKEAALILDLIRNIKQKGDVSVIVIAHNYAQVLEIADRVNLLQQGEITFDKPARDTSVQELNDIVIAEYRRALEERHRSA